MTPLNRQSSTNNPIDGSAGAGVGDPPESRWRRRARLAGASYLGMFALAVVGNFVLLGQVISPDPTTTAENIAQNPQLVRWGAVAFLLIVVLDVLLAWLLPILFEDVDRDAARLMGWFRLAYSVVLSIGVVFLVQASNSVASPDSTITFIDAFHTTWTLGLCLFGIHLMLLGWLIIRGRRVTPVLGALVILAGSAYVADTFSQITSSGAVDAQGPLTPVVATLSVVAEGWLTIWLLIARRRPRPASR